MTLRCKILGHKFTYTERDRDGETVVDAVCLRPSCEYEKELDQDWLGSLNA